MLNRRKYTGDGHAWNTIPDMELESLRRRGVVFLEGGFAKRGVRTSPPNPPGYGPEIRVSCRRECGVSHDFQISADLSLPHDCNRVWSDNGGGCDVALYIF